MTVTVFGYPILIAWYRFLRFELSVSSLDIICQTLKTVFYDNCRNSRALIG